jgi:hypothetical protein
VCQCVRWLAGPICAVVSSAILVVLPQSREMWSFGFCLPVCAAEVGCLTAPKDAAQAQPSSGRQRKGNTAATHSNEEAIGRTERGGDGQCEAVPSVRSSVPAISVRPLPPRASAGRTDRRGSGQGNAGAGEGGATHAWLSVSLLCSLQPVGVLLCFIRILASRAGGFRWRRGVLDWTGLDCTAQPRRQHSRSSSREHVEQLTAGSVCWCRDVHANGQEQDVLREWLHRSAFASRLLRASSQCQSRLGGAARAHRGPRTGSHVAAGGD